ncbi:MAG: hypothetical protein KKI08_25375 [Armatimonadetes bacterium]|nr:hypothetical protein [Armatimonadota bacterium]
MQYILAVTVVLAVGLLLGGCGGIIDDDNGLDLGDPRYPQYKDLTIILQVRDLDGWPVGGATVTVDGTDDLVTTDDQFHPLGDGYPLEWLGWLANWVSDFYQVVMNYAGDVDEFTIEVTKDGWTTDRSVVQIFDYEPEHIFIRDRMVIAPVGLATTSAVSAPHPALVVGGAAPVSSQSTRPRIIIQSTDD